MTAPTYRELIDDAERAATIEAHVKWETRRARRRDALHRAATAARRAATVTAQAVTALTPLVWLAGAGLSGAMLEASWHVRATGDDTLAWALVVPASLLAGAATKAALADTLSARAARRRATRAIERSRDLQAANETLQRAARTWRARAIHWQTIAERESREADQAMLHTPFGPELTAVRSLPDTRGRQR